MKRNNFVTNVLKCNNFHCLASLRLVDLNFPLHIYLLQFRKSSLPEASGFKSASDVYDWAKQLSSLPEASGFKLESVEGYTLIDEGSSLV